MEQEQYHSLENKVNNKSLEYGVDPIDFSSLKKNSNLSKGNLVGLAIIGVIALCVLAYACYFFFHIRREEKLEDESINFSKIAQDNSIESQKEKLEAGNNQVSNDDEETDDENEIDDENEEAQTDKDKDDQSTELQTKIEKKEKKLPPVYDYSFEEEGNTLTPTSSDSNVNSNDAQVAHLSYNASKYPSSQASIDSTMPSFRVSKGHNILCTLQTKIDTSYPGVITCLVAKPVYSDDGTLVLIEKGSLVIGQQANDLKGTSRAFVIWNEIKTPNDVVIRVDSPAGDSLGGTGIEGKINRQVLNKFFLGTMISIIKNTEDYLVNKHRKDDSAITINNDNMTNDQVDQLDQLANNLNQEFVEKRTLTVNPGTLVNIQLVRDLDFSKVYEKW